MASGATIVVVGGGIAGVSAVECLFADFERAQARYNRIVLITPSRLVKQIKNYQISGRRLERFEVGEAGAEDLNGKVPNGLRFEIIVGYVKQIKSEKKKIYYQTEKFKLERLNYDILALCQGASPKHFKLPSNVSPEVSKRIVVIRDTESVEDFQQKVSNCRQIVIVGNGGIGLEIVSRLTGCDKIWIIKDESMGLTFFDSGAAKFLSDNKSDVRTTVSAPHPSESSKLSSDILGPSLGPDWAYGRMFLGKKNEDSLTVIHSDEVAYIGPCRTPERFPLTVMTAKKRCFDCDLIVSAIGVEPNRIPFAGVQPKYDQDSAIIISSQMKTSIKYIFAAGDVVSCAEWPKDDRWFQMRLWTQARQMGHYMAKCMVAELIGEDSRLYFNFDCFTHCTSFFGHRVVLLGRYNAQGLDGENVEIVARVSPERDYVKAVLKDNRVIGAVLVGSSGLEETLENLIHDQLDVSPFKEHLLDETVDIEDYFD